MNDLDDPRRYHDIRDRIHGKWALESLYREVYAGLHPACVERCPSTGGVLEVGSGGGFAQELLPISWPRTFWPTRGSISCSTPGSSRSALARSARC